MRDTYGVTMAGGQAQPVPTQAEDGAAGRHVVGYAGGALGQRGGGQGDQQQGEEQVTGRSQHDHGTS